MKTEKISLTNSYFECLLTGDKNTAYNICNDYLAVKGNSIKQLYEGVIKPALYEVGELWEQNKISVAAEHLATAITEGIMNSLYTRIIPEKYNGKRVVVTCVDKEEHQVGIKMVADIFEMNNWESFFLGTGFPTTELIKFIDEVKPDILAISLSVFFNFSSLKQMLNDLVLAYPDLIIIIGGQALTHIDEDNLGQSRNLHCLSDLNELDSFITNFK